MMISISNYSTNHTQKKMEQTHELDQRNSEAPAKRFISQSYTLLPFFAPTFPYPPFNNFNYSRNPNSHSKISFPHFTNLPKSPIHRNYHQNRSTEPFKIILLRKPFQDLNLLDPYHINSHSPAPPNKQKVNFGANP